MLALGGAGHAQVIEIDEVISREVGIHIGGVATPEFQEVVSREASVFIENGRDNGEVISREISVVMDAAGAPPQVTGYTVTSSPDGSSVVLNWSNHNPWSVGDVALYRIYLGNQPFDDVAGLTPFLTVSGETLTATLAGLPTYQDHFIAIVAVDSLGNSNPAVAYSAAYILTKEVISREVSIALNAEPQPPYREVVSRELSVVRDNPGAPAPVVDFVVTSSPIGDTATLDWSSYNQWAQQDVAYYRVYHSDTLFTDLSGIPFVEMPGENFTHTFNGLVPWADHYFAIVPVDALGNSAPVFHYSAAYTISAEVISREMSVFMGQEPPAPPPVMEAIPVANFSFENPDTPGFIYWGAMNAGQRSSFAWTGAGNETDGPALFNNGSAWGYANVPDGSQGVSLQRSSSISRDFNFASPGSYTLTWSAASRTGQVNPYVMRLNGMAVSPVHSISNTAWQSNRATFEVPASGTYTITFAGLNSAGGDNSVGIDNVSLMRFESDGSRPFGSLQELVSREVSVVRPDATTPAPVTYAGSGFSATTARRTYGGISLDWSSYDEWTQRDVVRYRIYVSTTLFSDVTGMVPHLVIGNGRQAATISGLTPESIYYVAVVAEDVLGNFDPVVYPVSAKSAVGSLGDVADLSALTAATNITYSWDLGGVGDELADFVGGFRVYFNGSVTPVEISPSSRSWKVEGLAPETAYAVRITTVDLEGTESEGAVLNVTTKSIDIAGSLLVHLDAADYVANAATWPQRGSTEIPGGFTSIGTPGLDLVGGVPAVILDGGDEYFVGPTSTPALHGTGATHSVEMWVFQGNIREEESVISWSRRGGGAGTFAGFRYGTHADFGAVARWDQPDMGFSPSLGNGRGSPPVAGQWHHLVITYDGAATKTQRIYIDGVLGGSEVVAAPASGLLDAHDGFSINIGNERENNAGFTFNSGSTIPFSGAISRIRVHSGVLGPGSVLNNYNVEKGVYLAGIVPGEIVRQPLHRFSFNQPAGGAPHGTVVADQGGGPGGVIRGAGASFDGSSVLLPGGSPSSQAYIDLPNGIISAHEAVSLEIWSTQASNQRWSRLFDIGTTTVGEVTGPGGAFHGNGSLSLIANVDASTNQALEHTGGAPSNGPASRHAFDSAVLGAEQHQVFTYDPDRKEWRWYRNGVLMEVLPSAAGPTVINDVNVWIGRSNFGDNRNFHGEINEVRLYDYTLSENQIQGNHLAGADDLNLADKSVWASLYDLDPQGDGAMNEDPDQDGINNETEYAFGLDPRDASSVNPVTATLLADGTLSYTRRDPALTGFTYKVLTSTDLLNWTEDTGALQIPGPVSSQGVQSVVVTLGAVVTEGRIFARILATQ